MSDILGTLDEEELLEGGVDYSEELRELEDEGSMDIEELRRRYGYSLSGDDESAEAECDSSSEVGAVADVEGECETVDVEASESGDFFHLPYDELDEGDDSDDRDYAPPDPWRKDVRVDAGRYQAAVPESMNDEASLASSDNDNELPALPTPVPGGALWMPTDNLSEVDIDRFLGDVVELREAHGQTICDRFSLTRDDEDALCALYRHRYDTDKAKAAFPFSRVNQPFRTVRQGALEWDLSERDLFERGIAMYGKNFSVIQKRLLPYRRVGELVEYYYFWKKTDRYQMFRKHTVYAEPDMHCLGPPLFAHNQYAQHPYDGALPEVGGTRVDNDGVLPDMAGSGVLPSAEADTANLSATAASSQPPSEPPAPIAAAGDGDGEPKAERGDIWWNDDVPVAQV
ncbi:Myb-like DNA-binding domain protein [Teladorsagia circumcincta]|uniref:Myb-like DNA-binding domain protein n=1 Tax=Teladorsagia circumcincta TaxID=45464 RepID=A0A2G9UMG5_TELCI|nr:Myb-like DNA-binding domain protein [Teladorsagia circumcincta]